jgi:hypothetical protein
VPVRLALGQQWTSNGQAADSPSHHRLRLRHARRLSGHDR